MKLGDDTLILSALDALRMGAGDLGSDWRGGRLLLFAEGLVLGSALRLSSGVVAVNSLATPGGAPTIDASGEAGATPASQPGGAALDGGDGEPGGELGLYLERADPLVPPRLACAGGQGGGGQPGDATKDGGNGGRGGAGGRLTAWVGHPAQRWMDALRGALAMSDPAAMAAQAKPVLDELPAESASAKRLAAGLTGRPEDLRGAIGDALQFVEDDYEKWRKRLASGADVSGGPPGPYGVGRRNGRPGSAGPDGRSTIADLPGPTLPPFFAVHPSQCAMILAKAKLGFLLSDPGKDPQGVRDAAVLFERIRARTEPFVDLPGTAPLATYYDQREREFGSVASLATLRALHEEAETYLDYLRQGLDYFGYRGDHAPLTSLEELMKGVEKTSDTFGTIESAYDQQFSQLGQAERTLDHVETAHAHMASLAARDDAPALAATITATATVIDGYQQLLPRTKAALEDALAQYGDHVASRFDFDWRRLISAFGQIAFAPESPVMYVAQLTSILYEGATEVTDVQGTPVRKEYLVRKIQTVQADVGSILEGVQVLNDGRAGLDDPGAAKLLARRDQIEAMLDQFYGKLPQAAERLRDALKDHLATLMARNTEVVAYNAAVTVLARHERQRAALEAQARALDDAALRAMARSVPAAAAFVSQTYYRSRDQVLRLLDLAARAYRFWALDDADLLRETLAGTTPTKIDSVVLSSLRERLRSAYDEALGNVGDPQAFPADPASPGRTLVVGGAAIDALKATNELMIDVPPARRGTAGGPFAGLANVRISAVRAYLDGAKTKDDELLVQITHTGAERIVRWDDTLFQFRHPPVTKNFQYKIPERSHLVDGTFPVQRVGGRDVGLLGGCTTWHLRVDPAYNPGLDLSGVTRVELDFRGHAWAFD